MKKRELSIWKMIVSGFGLGFIPFAPGTMGALGALVPAILILKYVSFPNLFLTCLALLFTVLGILGSDKLQYLWGKDPSRIVIDEIVGMWISLLWLKTGWLSIALAFLLFRFFDMVKPLGIRKTERLPGGIGVMADDILAGIYANISLQAGFRLIPLLL